MTQDDELVTPPFDDILSGTSIRRAMVLAEALMEGSGRLLKGWVVREISVEEAKSCKEMMVLGGSFVRPITAFDDTVFGLDPSVPGPVSCRTALSPVPLCQTASAIARVAGDEGARRAHPGRHGQRRCRDPDRLFRGCRS